jgi:hypothetical protein
MAATKEKITLIKLSPELDPKNLARLESRSYDRGFTPVPNSALPPSYKVGLGVVYKALTGEELDPSGNTFAVSAANGIFKRLYAPAIFSLPADEEAGTPPSLCIVWGEDRIPLHVENGDIWTTEESRKNKNVKFGIREYGDFKDPSVVVTVVEGSNQYTFPFVVRPADIKDKLNVDEFEILVENSTSAEIADHVQNVPSGEGGTKFNGHFVKVSHLPLGEYTITGYRAKRDGQYGPDYFLQAKVEESFTAPVRVKVGEEWIDQETEIFDWCVVKPNSAMKKILGAEPEISEENPAVLTVLEHYMTKAGNPAAKVALQCHFPEDDESLGMDF